MEQSGAPLKNLVKDLKIITKTANVHELDLRATKVAKAVYQHYDQTGYGNSDMAVACRYYSDTSRRVKGKRVAGITRETSWAWNDIYDGNEGSMS